MSEPLQVRLSKAGQAVRDLEQQLDKFSSDNALREAVGAMNPARVLEGQQLQNRLYEARQRQTSLLLESISESSNRLETATRNLHQISESQVRVAESHVKISESQVKASESQINVTGKLLRSSRRLEKLTVFLIVVTLANIVVVVENILPLQYTVILMGFVLVALFFAFRYPMGDKTVALEKK